MAHSNDVYGSSGSVPNETPMSGSGAGPLSVRSNPDDFGAQVGGAVEKLGQEGEDISQKYLQMATDAKVNDDYANKYAPAAADLRQQYDMLRGPDKVAGYGNYIQGLQDLNKQFSSQGSFVYQKQISGLIDRHITGEIDGAKRELVESQKRYEDQSQWDHIKANDGYAATNFNNPDIVNQTIGTNDALIQKHYIDNGHASDSPAISEAQRQSRGNTAATVINSAISAGDLGTATQIRAQHSDALPDYQRNQIDDTLHVADMQKTGYSAVSALKTGQPIPQSIGAPAAQVQALVANNAQSSGIDPNHALTVLRIESANGQNLGKNPDRMSIGQDKESSGQPLGVQAATLCKNLKIAGTQASDALGRLADPWEGYVVYQQGAGGGPALLKADPNAKAYDVLRPLYKSNQEALSAITNNGGNGAMTAEDFLGSVRDTYNKNASRANCDFSGKNPGDAILSPHNTASSAVQPAATPTQSLINFDKKAQSPGGYLDQIQSIPNYEVRQGVMDAYKRERAIYSDKAQAYTSGLVNQAGQLMANPKFTSMDQVPPDMLAALTADHPQTIHAFSEMADYNRKKLEGTQDIKDGPKYSALQDRLFLDKSNPQAITDQAQLWPYVASHDLSPAGQEKLATIMDRMADPKGKAEATQKKIIFDNALDSIVPRKSRTEGDLSPEDATKIQNAQSAMESADEELIKKGIPSSIRYNSEAKEYVGNAAKPFIPTDIEQARQILSQTTSSWVPSFIPTPSRLINHLTGADQITDFENNFRQAMDNKTISPESADTLLGEALVNGTLPREKAIELHRKYLSKNAARIQ